MGLRAERRAHAKRLAIFGDERPRVHGEGVACVVRDEEHTQLLRVGHEEPPSAPSQKLFQRGHARRARWLRRRPNPQHWLGHVGRRLEAIAATSSRRGRFGQEFPEALLPLGQARRPSLDARRHPIRAGCCGQAPSGLVPLHLQVRIEPLAVGMNVRPQGIEVGGAARALPESPAFGHGLR